MDTEKVKRISQCAVRGFTWPDLKLGYTT
jgi:hypothetical protein